MTERASIQVDAATAFEVRANGETHPVAAGATVADFLVAHDLDTKLVVVERNGRILTRAALGETRLEPGDELEIVHFVGGG